MTLIVGVVAKDAIVLAADSQTTYESLKLPGTNKIAGIRFKCGTVILIAESGMVTLSNQAVEIIKAKAQEIEVETRDSVADLVRLAIRQVRRDQIDLFPSNTYSPEEWKTHFRDKNPVELTVAFYNKGSPCLFTITLDECVIRWSKDYTASGIGNYLGSYLLHEHFRPGMDFMLALVIAIKIAKAAATYVEGCGMPIKAALVHPSGFETTTLSALTKIAADPIEDLPTKSQPAIALPPKKVEEILEIILRVEQQTKEASVTRLHKELHRRTMKLHDRVLEALEAEVAKRKAAGTWTLA